MIERALAFVPLLGGGGEGVVTSCFLRVDV